MYNLFVAYRKEAIMEQFKDDDKGYLKWIRDNSDGYVVNCTRQLNTQRKRPVADGAVVTVL
jgi:hypothetical protein